MFQLPLLATLIATLATPAPQAARVLVSPTSSKSFAFDWDAMSADGTPHTVPIERVIFRFTDPADPTKLAWTHVVMDVDPGVTKITADVVLKTIAAGDWDMRVKLRDVAGSEGNYSTVTDRARVTVTRKKPSALTNVGVVDS